MDLRRVVDQYHTAADEFSRGDPLPAKMLFSHRDDVTLANSFGPHVREWKKVSKAPVSDMGHARCPACRATVLSARFNPVDHCLLLRYGGSHRVGGPPESNPVRLQASSDARYTERPNGEAPRGRAD